MWWTKRLLLIIAAAGWVLVPAVSAAGQPPDRSAAETPENPTKAQPRGLPAAAPAPAAERPQRPGRPPSRPAGGRGPGGRREGAGGPRGGPGGPNLPAPGERPRGRAFWYFGGPPRWPHRDWDTLEKGDPEMYSLLKKEHEMERQTVELAIQCRRAPRAQRPAFRKQLEAAVDQHFDVRQQRRRLELKRLQEELERLQEAIQRRTEMRKALVERRVSELLGEVGVDF